MRLNTDFGTALSDNLTTRLEKATAEERILEMVRKHDGGQIALTASFGIQSAVLLHMVSRLAPQTPIIFIDTQHLHDETYRYKRELLEKLGLNIITYRAERSAREQIAIDGQRWHDHEANDAYKWENKKEPMQRAVKDLSITAWISGLRRGQSERRADLPVLETDEQGVEKIYPLIDWTDSDAVDYMLKNDLPFHPLSYEGYRTIGDFFERPDIRAECGIHVPLNYDI